MCAVPGLRLSSHLRVLPGGVLVVGGTALVTRGRAAPASTEAPPVGHPSR